MRLGERSFRDLLEIFYESRMIQDEEGPEESSQTSKAQPRPGKKHGAPGWTWCFRASWKCLAGEARWMYKKATDGRAAHSDPIDLTEASMSWTK